MVYAYTFPGAVNENRLERTLLSHARTRDPPQSCEVLNHAKAEAQYSCTKMTYIGAIVSTKPAMIGLAEY